MKFGHLVLSVAVCAAFASLTGCSKSDEDEAESNLAQAVDMQTQGEDGADEIVRAAALDTLGGISFANYEDLYLDTLTLVKRDGVVRRRPNFDVNYKRVPDFKAISNISDRKNAFFKYIRPAIDYHNALIRERRQILIGIGLKLDKDIALSKAQTRYMETMRERYRVPGEAECAEAVALLLRRVDTIPASMVSSQAAMESAWGTSRFAREANNLFGQWCFSKGCGIVPKKRNAGAAHEIAKFATIEKAIGAYFLNINSHPAYSLTRNVREGLRDDGKALSGHNMVAGLEKYSARGVDYIEELRSLIRTNELE